MTARAKRSKVQQPTQAPTGLLPRSGTPQLDDAVKMGLFKLKLLEARSWPVLGTLVGVPCPVPTYTWLLVRFRVANRYAVRELMSLAPESTGGSLLPQLLPLMVGGMEFAHDATRPATPEDRAFLASLDYTDPLTYVRIGVLAPELIVWIAGDGYALARQIADEAFAPIPTEVKP